MRGQPQERYLELLESLNREHLRDRPGELDLEARIASYELAARMQSSARRPSTLPPRAPRPATCTASTNRRRPSSAPVASSPAG